MSNIAMLTQHAKGLLLLVMVVACASGARGATTYITNVSSRAITATISFEGTSDFVNRVAATGTHQADQTYASCSRANCAYNVHIEIWVEGADAHNHVDVGADRSIVGYDNFDKSGVDIYISSVGVEELLRATKWKGPGGNTAVSDMTIKILKRR